MTTDDTRPAIPLADADPFDLDAPLPAAQPSAEPEPPAAPADEPDDEAAFVAEAVAAWHAGDPDAVPSVRIRAAHRNLSCAQSGPEFYRRVRYPGAAGDEWPDAPRLPAPGIRAADRRCTTHCSVPIGTLVVHFNRDVYRGRRGRCAVSFHLARRDAGGDGFLVECPHRTLRARPVYEVKLPDGTLVEVPRREP